MEVSVCHHRDLVGSNSMSLNCTGNIALLAGRRSYALVNLACPDTLAYKVITRSNIYLFVVSHFVKITLFIRRQDKVSGRW